MWRGTLRSANTSIAFMVTAASTLEPPEPDIEPETVQDVSVPFSPSPSTERGPGGEVAPAPQIDDISAAQTLPAAQSTFL